MGGGKASEQGMKDFQITGHHGSLPFAPGLLTDKELAKLNIRELQECLQRTGPAPGGLAMSKEAAGLHS